MVKRVLFVHDEASGDVSGAAEDGGVILVAEAPRVLSGARGSGGRRNGPEETRQRSLSRSPTDSQTPWTDSSTYAPALMKPPPTPNTSESSPRRLSVERLNAPYGVRGSSISGRAPQNFGRGPTRTLDASSPSKKKSVRTQNTAVSPGPSISAHFANRRARPSRRRSTPRIRLRASLMMSSKGAGSPWRHPARARRANHHRRPMPCGKCAETDVAAQISCSRRDAPRPCRASE